MPPSKGIFAFSFFFFKLASTSNSEVEGEDGLSFWLGGLGQRQAFFSLRGSKRFCFSLGIRADFPAKAAAARALVPLQSGEPWAKARPRQTNKKVGTYWTHEGNPQARGGYLTVGIGR